MKVATVRDLRYDFPKIEHWLAAGEEIRLTKRGKPIGRVVPDKGSAKRPPPKIDFKTQLKATWGKRVFSAKEVAAMRDAADDEPHT